MKRTNVSINVIRGAAYAAVAFSISALGAESASALDWSPLATALPGNTAQCAFGGVPGHESACTGTSISSGTTLVANGQTGDKTIAVGGVSLTSISAAVVDPVGGESTSTTAPSPLRWHGCQCLGVALVQ